MIFQYYEICISHQWQHLTCIKWPWAVFYQWNEYNNPKTNCWRGVIALKLKRFLSIPRIVCMSHKFIRDDSSICPWIQLTQPDIFNCYYCFSLLTGFFGNVSHIFWSIWLFVHLNCQHVSKLFSLCDKFYCDEGRRK